jgi:hypothetical protein
VSRGGWKGKTPEKSSKIASFRLHTAKNTLIYGQFSKDAALPVPAMESRNRIPSIRNAM